jgi:hypothetical protein
VVVVVGDMLAGGANGEGGGLRNVLRLDELELRSSCTSFYSCCFSSLSVLNSESTSIYCIFVLDEVATTSGGS